MPDEHQRSIGVRIAGLRERQGWSQRALARWVGLDQSAVSRIEAGRRRLSAEELHRFADALHVTADVLLKGDAVLPAPAADDVLREHRASLLSGDFLAFAAERPQESERLALEADPDAFFELPDGAAVARARAPFTSSGARPRARISSLDHDRGPARPLPREEYSLDSAEPPAATGAARVAGLPGSVGAVATDWFTLRSLGAAGSAAERWSTGHSAEGRPERFAHVPASLRWGAPAGDVLYDRVARFWRTELHVDPEGPLPDLVPLLEDGYGAQVIVARVASPGSEDSPEGAEPAGRAGAAGPADRAVASGPADRAVATASADRPVAAAFTLEGVPFLFINAARPVVLQRFALAHAFAHLVLGHGDVVDRRVEWSRNVPPEAAANDFAEELLAPVGAVRRWYERRGVPRQVRLEDLLDLANAFGVSAWAALFRSRAAGRLQGKQFHVLRGELERQQWEVLPRQTFLGGLRDTLSHLTPAESPPPREYGGPAVLRVPAPMRAWALAAVRDGRLSLEHAAVLLRLTPDVLAEQLARLGLE